MKAPIKAHIAALPQAPFREIFEAALVDSVALTVEGDAPADTQVLIQGVPSVEQLAALPNLEALVIPYAGVPTPTRERIGEDGRTIKVYNLHHNAAPTAEMAVTLLLSAAKNIVTNHNALAGGDWRPRYAESRSILMSEKRALLLGYGAIGKRIATTLEALGMEVRILRRNPDPSDSRQHRQSELMQELPKADALVIACPLTDETRGLIGEAELAAMPRNAILVNVGRGLIVEQEALYDALAKGGIAAAGLDVWYNYPRGEASRADTPVGDYPFGELANVVMSPHCGGHSDATERLRATALAELLNNIAGGNAPTPVDLAAGY